MYRYNRAPSTSDQDHSFPGVCVRPKPGGEAIEDLLRRFKRKVSQSALLAEYRAREHYSPLGARRRSKRNRAARRRRRTGETI